LAVAAGRLIWAATELELRPLRPALLALCAALSLACAACLDGESSFASQAFKAGVTTRSQAIAALGPPSSVYVAANGDKTLSWARGGGLFNPGETRQYAILFGPDDVMIRVVAGAEQR
jgi:hypothetical protein